MRILILMLIVFPIAASAAPQNPFEAATDAAKEGKWLDAWRLLSSALDGTAIQNLNDGAPIGKSALKMIRKLLDKSRDVRIVCREEARRLVADIKENESERAAAKAAILAFALNENEIYWEVYQALPEKSSIRRKIIPNVAATLLEKQRYQEILAMNMTLEFVDARVAMIEETGRLRPEIRGRVQQLMREYIIEVCVPFIAALSSQRLDVDAQEFLMRLHFVAFTEMEKRRIIEMLRGHASARVTEIATSEMEQNSLQKN